MNSGALLKQIGLDLVTNHNPDFLYLVRTEAERLCRKNGLVSADELREWAKNNGITPNHPNAWGAVFRTGFRRVGYKQSTTTSAHHRAISVWKLA